MEVTLPSASLDTTDWLPSAASVVTVWLPSGLVTVVTVEPSGRCSTSVSGAGAGGAGGTYLDTTHLPFDGVVT